MALMATRTKLSRFIQITLNLNSNTRGSIFHHSYSSSASSAAAATEAIGVGFDLFGVKDYEDYRRSLYGEITHKALLVDAVGTLVVPSQPMAQVLNLFFFFLILHCIQFVLNFVSFN